MMLRTLKEKAAVSASIAKRARKGKQTKPRVRYRRGDVAAARFEPAQICDRSASTHQARNQRNHQEDEEKEEKDLRDTRGGTRDAAETKYTRYDCHNEKDKCIV